MELNKIVNKVPSSNSMRYVPDDFKKIARSMEQQFINHMIQQMEKTSLSSNETQADSFYKGLQRDERAKIITELSGEGSLKELILDQIYPERYRNETSYNAFINSQNQKLNAYKKNIGDI